VQYSLAPLFDNHFNLNFGDVSNTRYVFIFICVAFLILALALINYMNLATARSTTRAKEVGIRKVIGASMRTLSIQFYVESAFTAIISFGLALIIMGVLRPFWLDTLQQQVDTSFLASTPFIMTALGLLLLCVFLSGSYPALVLPRFKPAEVLKGKVAAGVRGVLVRKILIVFQFSVSVGLVICTLVMNRQMEYIQQKNIGMNRDQVMAIPIDQLPAKDHRALKDELRRLPNVVGVGDASIPMFKASMSGLALVTSPVSGEKIGTQWIIVDEGFLQALRIEWKMQPDVHLLDGSHIINETAAEEFNLGNRLTDQEIAMGGDAAPRIKGKISGIVKDFNYKTLRSRIEPLIMSVVSDTSAAIGGNSTLYVRINPDSKFDAVVPGIRSTYTKYLGTTPFSYYFLDDAFDDLQKGEKRLSRLFGVFTAVALGIACLGLFGLITFTTEQRTKEISIRKILGATSSQIVSLLSLDLVLLLMISFVVGSPVAWTFMNNWVNNFFYRTNIPIWIIGLSCVLVIVFSVIVISLQGVKVALDNPAKNLKNE
jgi:putative ABC transport system permease protein